MDAASFKACPPKLGAFHGRVHMPTWEEHEVRQIVSRPALHGLMADGAGGGGCGLCPRWSHPKLHQAPALMEQNQAARAAAGAQRVPGPASRQAGGQQVMPCWRRTAATPVPAPWAAQRGAAQPALTLTLNLLRQRLGQHQAAVTPASVAQHRPTQPCLPLPQPPHHCSSSTSALGSTAQHRPDQLSSCPSSHSPLKLVHQRLGQPWGKVLHLLALQLHLRGREQDMLDHSAAGKSPYR